MLISWLQEMSSVRREFMNDDVLGQRITLCLAVFVTSAAMVVDEKECGCARGAGGE
jgi:hypothetical protein